MTTLEPAALRRLVDRWEAGIDSAEKRNDAATFSGIVGDAAHRRDGGYHISREDQPASNYSVADYPQDRQGPSNLAAAVDMNMIEKDMRLVFGRLYRSFKDRNDPRLNHVRGINGTLDGQSAIRIDCQAGTEEPSSSDHTWHIHLEVLRQYVEDDQTMTDILSIILDTYQSTGDDLMGVTIAGEPIEQYLPRIERSLLWPVLGIAKDVSALKVAAAGDATATAGLRAAVDALAAAINRGGGNIDVATITAAIDAKTSEVKQLVEQRHAEEMAALQAERDAEVAALQAQLVALHVS